MRSTDEGTETDGSDPQNPNADSPRTETRQEDSNVKAQSLPQNTKHDLPIVSTDEGMQID
jgi:hypothetical protein